MCLTFHTTPPLPLPTGVTFSKSLIVSACALLLLGSSAVAVVAVAVVAAVVVVADVDECVLELDVADVMSPRELEVLLDSSNGFNTN
jgi:hypothetical protein